MSIRDAEFHHYGIRLPPASLAATEDFYREVLGFSIDARRPEIPGVPGSWMQLPGGAQIHLMGISGTSPFAKAPDQDPTSAHVAFGVSDLEAAKRELESREVPHWILAPRGAPPQVFFRDPGGTLVELHQSDTCTCRRTDPVR